MLNLFSRGDATEPTILNTRVEPYVRIINASLDEEQDAASGVVINGRIDPSTLRFLKVDSAYQRPLGVRADIFNALKEGKVVPNIEIGVRGQDFVSDGNDIIIKSPAYIIDGWQRVGNALRLLELVPHHNVRIFGSIHFGTDEIWERHRFTELNKNIKKISPNLHLRNMRDSNDSILTLYGLSNSDRNFPLYKKVSWSQNMGRGEIVSAMVLTKVVRRLHGHRIPNNGVSAERLAADLARIPTTVTLPTFRRNVSLFFSIIDECWPFSAIEYRASASQVKSSFLLETARMLSNHSSFWENNDNTLAVVADDRRKLSKFPINDPQVLRLAGSGGASGSILYQLLVDHMNSGRRTQRLRSRSEAA